MKLKWKYKIGKGRVIYYQLGGGEPVTFSCDVQNLRPPPPPNPTGKKNSTPPLDLWQKSWWPPPNSQYSSPQTESFIFAININIATTYLKIVCRASLNCHVFCASFHAHGDKVTKIMLFIKGVLGLEPKDFWCWQGTRKVESTEIERTDIIFNLNKTIFNLSTDYAKLNATITDHNLYLTTLLSKAHNEKVKGQCFWIHCDPTIH